MDLQQADVAEWEQRLKRQRINNSNSLTSVAVTCFSLIKEDGALFHDRVHYHAIRLLKTCLVHGSVVAHLIDARPIGRQVFHVGGTRHPNLMK